MSRSSEMFLEMREMRDAGRKLTVVNHTLINVLKEFTEKKAKEVKLQKQIEELHDKYGYGATFKLNYGKLLNLQNNAK